MFKWRLFIVGWYLLLALWCVPGLSHFIIYRRIILISVWMDRCSRFLLPLLINGMDEEKVKSQSSKCSRFITVPSSIDRKASAVIIRKILQTRLELNCCCCCCGDKTIAYYDRCLFVQVIKTGYSFYTFISLHLHHKLLVRNSQTASSSSSSTSSL